MVCLGVARGCWEGVLGVARVARGCEGLLGVAMGLARGLLGVAKGLLRGC